MGRVAITGAYGTIGTVLRNGLEEKGHDVTAIDISDRAAEDPNGYQIDLSAPRNRDHRLLDEDYTVPGSNLEGRTYGVDEGGRTDYEQLKGALKEQDAVIHLAWNIGGENFDTPRTAPENKWMTENIYAAAEEVGLETVIMGSSIHAAGLPAYAHPMHLEGVSEDQDDVTAKKLEMTPEPYRSIIEDRIPDPDEDDLFSPYVAMPDSPYGETKAYHMEQLGRQHAMDEDAPRTVVDARFGGVNDEDLTELPEEPEYDTIASSHRNTVNFVHHAIEADGPGYFKGYVMSDNDGCPYKLGIPELDIKPLDNTADTDGRFGESIAEPPTAD